MSYNDKHPCNNEWQFWAECQAAEEEKAREEAEEATRQRPPRPGKQEMTEALRTIETYIESFNPLAIGHDRYSLNQAREHFEQLKGRIAWLEMPSVADMAAEI